MERVIWGFHRDDVGDWVAEVSCGHNQHVRHAPPFQLREWVLDRSGRDARLGTAIECSLCDRADMPSGLRRLWSTPEWDEHSVPPGLLRPHFVFPGTWGQMVLHEGRLGLVTQTTPTIDVVLGAGAVHPLPPDVEHEFHLIGPVRFALQFLAIDRGVDVFTEPTSQHGQHHSSEHGGEREGLSPPPHLVCPECGISLRDCRHG